MDIALASFACASLSTIGAECTRRSRIGWFVLAVIFLPLEGRTQVLVPIQLEPIEVVVNGVAGYDSALGNGVSLGVRANCIEVTIEEGYSLNQDPASHAIAEFAVPGVQGDLNVVVAKRVETPSSGGPEWHTSLALFDYAGSLGFRSRLIGLVTSELLAETYALPFEVNTFDPVDTVAQAWVAGDRIRWELRGRVIRGPYSLRLSAWSIASSPAGGEGSCDTPVLTEECVEPCPEPEGLLTCASAIVGLAFLARRGRAIQGSRGTTSRE